MNWGTKLVIAMALFMAFIIALSTKMILSDKDDLVDKDYYEKGLNYDLDYQRKQNMENDKAEPKIELEPKSMKVVFVQPATGTVTFAHSKDRRLDRKFTINTGNSSEAVISLIDIAHGSWHLTFEWKSGDKMYMFKKEVFIQ